MFNSHPESFSSKIAEQRRSDFELAAQHARLVRSVRSARKERRRAAAGRPEPCSAPHAPAPCCAVDVG
jgi:hypothetical protein